MSVRALNLLPRQDMYRLLVMSPAVLTNGELHFVMFLHFRWCSIPSASHLDISHRLYLLKNIYKQEYAGVSVVMSCIQVGLYSEQV